MRQFEHILLLAKTLNFTKAARQAHLSQSAFSKSIAAFEEKRGIQVFIRTTGSVTITDLGLQVIKEIQSLVFEINNFEKNVTNIKQGDYGSVSFGAGPYPAEIFIKDALKDFHLENPKIHLTLKVDYWDGLLKKLYNSEIDFFIADIRSIEKYVDLEFIPIGGVTVSFFCDKHHPLVQNHKGVIPPEELMLYKFATVSLPSIILNELKHSLHLSHNHTFDFIFQCDDLDFIHNMIKNTEIIGISSNYFIDKLIKENQVVRPSMAMDKNRFGDWALVKIKNRTLFPAASKLANLLINRIRAGSLYDDQIHGLRANQHLNFL